MKLGPFQTSAVTAADLDALSGKSLPRRPLRRDGTINPGTLALFDFASQFGRPPVTPLVQNTPMANLVQGGAPALATPLTTVAGITYAGGGVQFALASNQFYGFIDLGDIAPAIGLMTTVWFRSSDAGDNGFNTRLMGIEGLFYTSMNISDGVHPTVYEVVSANASDTTVQSPDVLAAMSDGQLHQLSHWFEPRPGGKYRVVTFLDRVKVYTGAEYTFATQANPTKTYIGNEGAQTITGRFYRVRVDQVSAAMMTAEDLIAADWDANIGRLAALPGL